MYADAPVLVYAEIFEYMLPRMNIDVRITYRSL